MGKLLKVIGNIFQFGGILVILFKFQVIGWYDFSENIPFIVFGVIFGGLGYIICNFADNKIKEEAETNRKNL